MITIPNLGLSIQNGVYWTIGISFLLTLISFVNKNKTDPILREIKKKEEQLSFFHFIELYVIRFVHYISTIYIVFLPYMFKPELWMYIIYEIYLVFAVLSWYLVRECPFTIKEKQILDPKYVNGNTHLQPFMALLMPNNIYLFVFTTIYSINFSLISYNLFTAFFSNLF
jgi:hypothetical protein